MRRYLFALSAMLVLFVTHTVLAQDPTPVLPVPVEADPYRMIWSAIVPLFAALGGPLGTHWIKGLPPWAKYLISAAVAIITNSLGSEYTAYPMHPDAAATASLSISMAAQRLLGMTSGEDALIVAQVDKARAEGKPTVVVSVDPVKTAPTV